MIKTITSDGIGRQKIYAPISMVKTNIKMRRRWRRIFYFSLLMFFNQTINANKGGFKITSISVEGAITLASKNTGKHFSTNYYVDAHVKNLKDLYNTKLDRRTYHLISHGKPGELFLENEWKNPSEIAYFMQSKLVDLN